MALTRTAQAAQASATNAAAATTNGSSFAVNYGVSGLAQITNGGTGPSSGCSFNLQVSNDGGTTWFTIYSQTAGVTAGTTYPFPFSFGVCGANGDWDHYRTQFTGNATQPVTVQADAESTVTL